MKWGKEVAGEKMAAAGGRRAATHAETDKMHVGLCVRLRMHTTIIRVHFAKVQNYFTSLFYYYVSLLFPSLTGLVRKLKQELKAMYNRR